jgi:hypothetical protein
MVIIGLGSMQRTRAGMSAARRRAARRGGSGSAAAPFFPAAGQDEDRAPPHSEAILQQATLVSGYFKTRPETKGLCQFRSLLCNYQRVDGNFDEELRTSAGINTDLEHYVWYHSQYNSRFAPWF